LVYRRIGAIRLCQTLLVHKDLGYCWCTSRDITTRTI